MPTSLISSPLTLTFSRLHLSAFLASDTLLFITIFSLILSNSPLKLIHDMLERFSSLDNNTLTSAYNTCLIPKIPFIAISQFYSPPLLPSHSPFQPPSAFMQKYPKFFFTNFFIRHFYAIECNIQVSLIISTPLIQLLQCKCLIYNSPFRNTLPCPPLHVLLYFPSLLITTLPGYT